jgi:AraC-like DNA-binding protein
MYNIYTTDMAFEQCAPDKTKIDCIIPYSVLHFVLSGEGYINGQKVTTGTVFISFENNRMNYYPSKNDPWSYIYVRLMGDEIKKAFQEHNFNLGLSVVPFSDTESLFQILSLYQKLSYDGDPTAKKIIANAIFLLFKKEYPIALTKSMPRQHVERIAKFIKENYYKKLTIEEIAKKFYLNKNYIRTIFVEQMCISPKQYLQKIRMERAAFLLINTDEDISLIAKSVGYDDALLFSKMFKQHYSISPQKYRKKNKI